MVSGTFFQESNRGV